MPIWLISLLPTIVEGLIQIIEDLINKKKLGGENISAELEALNWLQGYKARNDALKQPGQLPLVKVSEDQPADEIPF
jgi:hypothetical protein